MYRRYFEWRPSSILARPGALSDWHNFEGVGELDLELGRTGERDCGWLSELRYPSGNLAETIRVCKYPRVILRSPFCPQLLNSSCAVEERSTLVCAPCPITHFQLSTYSFNCHTQHACPIHTIR